MSADKSEQPAPDRGYGAVMDCEYLILHSPVDGTVPCVVRPEPPTPEPFTEQPATDLPGTGYEPQTAGLAAVLLVLGVLLAGVARRI